MYNAGGREWFRVTDFVKYYFPVSHHLSSSSSFVFVVRFSSNPVESIMGQSSSKQRRILMLGLDGAGELLPLFLVSGVLLPYVLINRPTSVDCRSSNNQPDDDNSGCTTQEKRQFSLHSKSDTL